MLIVVVLWDFIGMFNISLDIFDVLIMGNVRKVFCFFFIMFIVFVYLLIIKYINVFMIILIVFILVL